MGEGQMEVGGGGRGVGGGVSSCGCRAIVLFVFNDAATTEIYTLSLHDALPIFIGVSAVILLTALGNGIQAGFSEQFAGLNTQITVTPTEGAVPGGGQARNLTENDMDALLNPRNAPDVATVTPVVGGAALLQLGGAQYRTSITGTTADYLTITDRKLTSGRGFDEQEVRTNAKVVVLGPGPVGALFGGSDTAA